MYRKLSLFRLASARLKMNKAKLTSMLKDTYNLKCSETQGMLQVVILVVLATLWSISGEIPKSFFICEAGDEKILGEYVQGSETKDGVNVYSNANDLSIFRNNDFWYIGNLG